jgi:hypothetical protein
MRSLVPYLNERNVVASMPVSEIIWDHPDRETNPLASAPGDMIFSKLEEEDKKDLNFFKKEFFTDITSNNIKKEDSINENIFSKTPKNEPDYVNMYKAESEKNIILENQIKDLRSLLEKKNVTKKKI